jgi:pimeloyl-ACP methyl ester carboxylesterase
MSTRSIYRTPEGEAEIHALYDQQLARLGLPYESRMVDTRFGATHVLTFGPREAPPVVTLHGGNASMPLFLRPLRPLIEKYRVYAPDTIGHAGKSAPVRLSTRDDSYGWWLVDVLDALDLQRPAVVTGSYGAGILLRAAACAPERIAKAVLSTPSSLVSVPISTMAYWAWRLLLYWLKPTPARLRNILRRLSNGEPIDKDVIETIQAVFRHVRIEWQMPRNVTRKELVDFKAPTLVIAAERDAMFPGQAVVKRAREVFPNLIAAEVIAGAAHYPTRYHQAYLIERCERFLRETN